MFKVFDDVNISTYLLQPIQGLICGSSIASFISEGAVENLLHTELLQLGASYSVDRLYGTDHTEGPTTPTLQRDI